MSDKAGDSSVNESGAASGVSEDAIKSIVQKVVMGVINDALPRLVDKAISKSVPSLLDKIAEEAIKEDPAATTTADANGGAQSQERLSMKALQQQLAEMQRGIKERDEQIKTERQRATETRLRSDVQAQFARYLGADSPHLAPYVKHFLDQFADHEGSTARKVKNEYGEDSYVPVDKAVDELFKSDLKHLVQPARPNLPPAGIVRGQPAQQQQGQRGPGFLQEAMNHLATVNPALGNAIGIGNNGTPQK